MFVLYFVCLCVAHGLAQGLGDSCSHNGVSGVCILADGCPSVLADRWKLHSAKLTIAKVSCKISDNDILETPPHIREFRLRATTPKCRLKYERCGFRGREPIICCTDSNIGGTEDRFVATTPLIRSTTTEYTPPIADYKELVPGAIGDGTCAPVPPKDTTAKTGRKAFDKCIEYQEQLVYPCERGVDYTGKKSRGNYCSHNADELIVGGKDAKRDEFPHMALLSYGDGSSTSTVCGGTIISENFILTAGHCTYAPRIGLVTSVKVGLLRMTEDVPSRREHRVKRIIKHPQYKAPSKYHDIALLETETPIILGPNAIPACLDIGEAVDDSRAAATGWGHNKSLGEVLDVLQKVTLQKFTPQECTEKFRNVRHLTQGYDERTQICYGDHEEKKDTCQGDSGGPLQINNPRIHCMYTVIGVTSFGKYCGQIGRPGMYTRVSHYAGWIESVVWP